MQFTEVRGSEVITRIGYDAAAQRLRIETVAGRSYDYVGVPPAAHQAILNASSKGRAWAEIKRSYRQA